MFSAFERTGIGLHTGVETRVVVEPGDPGSGIHFMSGGVRIPATSDALSDDARLGTTLVAGGRVVRTVEHLLAAATAVIPKDISIAIEGPEVPILDGSALPWYRAFMDAGAEPGFCFIDPPGPVFIQSGDSEATLSPIGEGEAPSLHVELVFDAPAGPEGGAYHPARDGFETIASARTFAFEDDLKQIFDAGFAKGGSLENAVVFGSAGPLNPEGLRFEDEALRHKILDAVGDLGLLGGLPRARIDLLRPGHHLVHALVREIAHRLDGGDSRTTAWRG
jgi:UDP-3-O-[3-hydroxymyristoyl] N-acetylglucosamine deacetylase